MREVDLDDSPPILAKPLGHFIWPDGHRVPFFSVREADALKNVERDVPVWEAEEYLRIIHSTPFVTDATFTATRWVEKTRGTKPRIEWSTPGRCRSAIDILLRDEDEDCEGV